MPITVEETISAPVQDVWNGWTSEDAVKRWNFCNDDWHCPEAVIDLKAGKRFRYRMAAKDGSMEFDFEGTFTEITPQKKIVYVLDDGREVTVDFKECEEGLRVSETFEAEDEMSAEQQREGWLGILKNFKRYVEAGTA